MARQNITATRLVANSGRAVPDDVANADGYKLVNSVVTYADKNSRPIDRTLLRVDRTDATGSLSVVAKGATVPGRTDARGADSRTVVCAPGVVTYVGPFSSDSVIQEDDSVLLDLVGTATGTRVGVFVLPIA